MEDYKIKDNILTKNSLILIDRLQSEIDRLKIERIKDDLLLRTLNFFQTEIEKIRTLINENPKFDWLLFKNEANRLITIDKNLTGIKIELSHKKCEKGKENWGVISGKIGEALT
jgi:hypothetical protein